MILELFGAMFNSMTRQMVVTKAKNYRVSKAVIRVDLPEKGKEEYHERGICELAEGDTA
jgi:hypothetical protein